MFKDHFSQQSKAYADSRPDYPTALYERILAEVKEQSLCWDVATGNGQAAVSLAAHFQRVVGTDASGQQIEQAFARPNVEYRCEPAEQSSLEDHSVDLVTVAQALHWFDFDAFYSEVMRVLKPGGVIAVWSYGLVQVNEAIDPHIRELYSDTLGPYWPAERGYVDKAYQSIPFPFSKVEGIPALSIEKTWPLEAFIHYLESWSALQAYRAQTGELALEAFCQKVAPLWREPQTVRWPIALLIGSC